MDRLDALVAVAHRRLRLRRWLMAIERDPKLLEGDMLDIKRPMELAGLKGRLARARQQEQSIKVTGERYDAVLDRIDELHDAGRSHVGALEVQEDDLRRVIEGMVGGSNGGPNGEESSEASSEGGQGIGQGIGQVITSKPAVEP